ncbi:MAG: N-acetylmuramidase family protein [Terricaulis sp.]
MTPAPPAPPVAPLPPVTEPPLSPVPPPATVPTPTPSTSYLDTLRATTRDPIRRADFEAVAAQLGCEWEAVAAVSEVESGPLGGFAADGRPIILYERHLFSRKTNHQYDASHPTISNSSAGGYPRTQNERWAQLTQAYALAPDAAIESASYGRFQILGQNYGNLGMTAHAYVSKMAKSEKDQLECFVGFVRANGLVDELQRRDWAGFARRYNGPGYAANQYDTKMAAAYDRLKATPIA